MHITMEWKDMTFKGSQIVGGLLLLIPVITYLINIDSKQSMTMDNQFEMRKTQVKFIDDYYVDREAVKNDINMLKLELQLLKQRVDAIEKSK